MGDPLRGGGGRDDVPDPYLVLQLRALPDRVHGDPRRGDRRDGCDRRGAGGGDSRGGRPAGPPRLHAPGHRAAGVAGGGLRLRDEPGAAARSRARARVGVGPHHHRGSHCCDHAHRRPPHRRAVSDEQRDSIERLEWRVATLEELVRRLVHARAIPDAARPLPRADPGRPPPGETPPPPPSPPPPLAPPTAAPSADLEQWFGQRGLLVIGVVALLAAAAFFLKYAFDRGWIPPLVRSLLAVAAGIGVAVWGEDRIRHGMRRYGAAMIGAGGGLVYLGLWAAAGPYALLDRRAGVLLLAASSVAVTLLALHHEIEGLAIWALAGAYLTPTSCLATWK
ncbi:MAG: hypothetical protein DMD36_04280 [Gemmatimonadetes bacterium]|nr:MAG: hypothetical protein DMD36_04280 [Gemmatimonadota bacterium]